MRAYEFRGKTISNFPESKNTVVIPKGKWIYGGITYDEDRVWIDMPYYGQIIVDKETIGQYTGLKDKNGKKIYGGDIVDFSYDVFVGNFDTRVAKGIVKFEKGAFWIGIPELEEQYLLYEINIDSIEVIGNIVDNPELLGGE